MAGGRPRGSPLRITSKSLLRADVGIGPYGGETEIHPLSGGRGRTPPLRIPLLLIANGRRRENREAPTRVPPWGSIDSLRFDTAAGEILFHHQSYLEGDSVVEFPQVQACELFDLLQTIDQGIAVNE